MEKLKFEKLSDRKFDNLTKEQMNHLFGGEECQGYKKSEGKTIDLGSGGTLTYSNDWEKGDESIQIANKDMDCDALEKHLKYLETLNPKQ